MSRRYPGADDLWQRIQQEEDFITRRDLLVEMSEVLLTLDDTDSSLPSGDTEADCTDLLLKYQMIADHVSTRMQQALPWIDPDFKGEPLEQELQEVHENLVSLVETTSKTLEQVQKLKDQKAELEIRQQELKSQEEELLASTDTLQNSQLEIEQLERGISELNELLKKYQDTDQQEDRLQVMEAFNPVLENSLKHYQNLVIAWQQHQEQNDTVTEALNLREEVENASELLKIPTLARSIGDSLEEYDRVLRDILS